MKGIKKVLRIDSGDHAGALVLDGVFCSAADVAACADVGIKWGLDAAETMVFTRALSVVKAKIYKKLYQGLKARTFVNVSNEAGPAVDTLFYRMWDSYVMAKLVSNYATDIPLVTASAQEFSIRFASFADAYAYSIQDIRRADATGTALEAALGEAARRGIEQSLDEVLAKGIPSLGTYGLLNHPNVPIVTLSVGSWTSATDPLNVVKDINQLVQAVVTNSAQFFEPDSILFPTAAWALVTQMPMGVTSPGETVMSFVRKTNPYLKNFDQWTKLDNASASGGRRLMVYKKDAEAQEGEIGQEFEQFPAQSQGLAFVVPCHARAAGVIWRHPYSGAFADNV
jgi:hypothetical protein